MGAYNIFSPTKILKYFSELPLDLFIEVHPRIDAYNLTAIQFFFPSKYFLTKFIHLLLLDHNSLGFKVVLRLAKSELGLVRELLIEIVFLLFISICPHHVLVPILLLSFHRNRVIIHEWVDDKIGNDIIGKNLQSVALVICFSSTAHSSSVCRVHGHAQPEPFLVFSSTLLFL